MTRSTFFKTLLGLCGATVVAKAVKPIALAWRPRLTLWQMTVLDTRKRFAINPPNPNLSADQLRELFASFQDEPLEPLELPAYINRRLADMRARQDYFNALIS